MNVQKRLKWIHHPEEKYALRLYLSIIQSAVLLKMPAMTLM